MQSLQCFKKEIVKGPTPSATRQNRTACAGGSEGGSCLLKHNGTQRGMVIQDVHCLCGESLKVCVNLGFIHQSSLLNIRPSWQKTTLLHLEVAKFLQKLYV